MLLIIVEVDYYYFNGLPKFDKKLKAILKISLAQTIYYFICTVQRFLFIMLLESNMLQYLLVFLKYYNTSKN